MAKFDIKEWIKENPNGTFEDYKKAAEAVGQKVSELEKACSEAVKILRTMRFPAQQTIKEMLQ